MNFKPIKPVPYPSERPYKVYTFLFTQEGTSAPEVVILENTIGNIVWTRLNTGSYVGTLSGAFPTNKTIFTCLQGEFLRNLQLDEGEDGIVMNVQIATNNTVSINLTGASGLDSKFSNTPFEIRVYP